MQDVVTTYDKCFVSNVSNVKRDECNFAYTLGDMTRKCRFKAVPGTDLCELHTESKAKIICTGLVSDTNPLSIDMGTINRIMKSHVIAVNEYIDRVKELVASLRNQIKTLSESALRMKNEKTRLDEIIEEVKESNMTNAELREQVATATENSVLIGEEIKKVMKRLREAESELFDLDKEPQTAEPASKKSKQIRSPGPNNRINDETQQTTNMYVDG